MTAVEKRNHSRAPGQAQTTISLPQELLDRIQDHADRSDRSRNKMITHLLREAADRYDKEKRRL